MRILFFIFLTLKGLNLSAQEPDVLFLTWVDQPSQSIVIQWHSNKSGMQGISYQKKGDNQWILAQGEVKKLHQANVFLYSLRIKDLSEDSQYLFKFEKKVYGFQTLPKDLGKRPIRFVIAGDAYQDAKLFRSMNEQIVKKNPDFIVIGGDIAYAERPFRSRPGKIQRWESFFKLIKKQLMTTDDRIIPIVPVVGNHDVAAGENPQTESVLFYEYFTFPIAYLPYRTLQIGDYAAIIMLDRGHSYPIRGEQTQWLKKTLQDHAGVPYRFAVYHVPAYPSVHSDQRLSSREIRENWVPLFEEHYVTAFEHHNHAYKRTHPIRNGKIDPTGIIYLGDGAWGVPPRVVHNAWYLAKAKSLNNFWLLTLTEEKCQFQAFDIHGELIEEFSIPKEVFEAHGMAQAS